MSFLRTLRAPLLMTSGAACLIINDALVKLVTESLPKAEVIALRALAITLVCAILLLISGRRLSNPFNQDMLLRTGFTIGNVYAFVTAVSLLPFSIAVLVDFTNILFVTLFAPFVLSERLTVQKVLAVCLGLFGAGLVLISEFKLVGLAVLMPVLSGFLGAGRELWTRRLRNGPRPEELTLYAALGMIIIAFIPGVEGWSFEVDEKTGLAFLAGVFQSIALILMASAFYQGEASLVAPFRLTSLIWALLLAWFVFDESLTLVQVIGVGGILAGLSLTIMATGRARKDDNSEAVG